MARQIQLGDIVRDEWGDHEVAEIEDTPHGRLLKLRLGEDEFEPFAWVGEAFVELVAAQPSLLEDGG